MPHLNIITHLCYNAASIIYHMAHTSSASTPALSIIIITYNEERTVSGILSDLAKQSHRDFEVIVADSASTDKTRDVVMSHRHHLPSLRFIDCHATKGPSFGRNVGAQHARAERLLFFDADTRLVSQHFLRDFLHLATTRRLDAGTFYLSTKHTRRSYRIGYVLMNISLRITQPFSPTACGAFLFSTRTVHRAIGGFREDVMLCEDCDYVRDAKRHGFRVGVIPLSCAWSERRLHRDGTARVWHTYLRANIIRFITGRSIRKDEVSYTFGNHIQ